MRLLQREGVTSQVGAILRQELDSMIRVIYLLSIADKNYRAELIHAAIEGDTWKKPGTTKRITDKDMVELANKLQGWTESVYRFGCSFIHLSNSHDYQWRNPIDALNSEEKTAILKHMRYYHGGPQNNNPRFEELIPYLPSVFEKITNNLECYLKDLEQGKSLADDEI